MVNKLAGFSCLVTFYENHRKGGGGEAELPCVREQFTCLYLVITPTNRLTQHCEKQPLKPLCFFCTLCQSDAFSSSFSWCNYNASLGEPCAMGINVSAHSQLGVGGGGWGVPWVPEPVGLNAKISGKRVCFLELSWVLCKDDQIMYCSGQVF